MMTAAIIIHVLLHEVPLALGAIVVACRFCKRLRCHTKH